jgi:signal transduction histidine kinase/ActR/RegA family two-component response regulator
LGVCTIIDSEEKRLAALLSLGLLDTGREPEYDALADLATLVTGASMSAVSLVDENRQWFKSEVGLPVRETPRNIAFCDHAIRQAEIFHVPDAWLDDRFKDNPLVTGAPFVRGYAGVSIRAPGGERIGTICAIHHEPLELDDAARRRMVALARSVEDIISARQRANALTASKRRYDLAVAASSTGIWEVDFVTGRRFMSERMLDIVGREPGESPVGNRERDGGLAAVFQNVHPDDAERLRSAIERHQETREALEVEFRYRRVDDSYIDLFVRGQSDWSADGDPIRMAGSAVDVTEHNQLLLERRRASERLEEVTRLGGIGAWEVDLKLEHLFWDETVREIHEVDGGYVPDLGGAIEFYDEDARPLMQRAVELGVATGQSWDLELPLTTARKRRIWVRAVGRGVIEDGEVVRLIGSFQDITERRSREEELRRQRYRAEVANLAKSDFLANMSHEIRTPLNGVLGMSQILQLSDLDPDQTKQVETIQRSGEALADLIEDILDISRIESGQIQFEDAPFELSGMVSTVVELMRVAADEKGLEINHRISADMPSILVGDQKRVRQILINMVGNAVKFTSEGKIDVSSTVTSDGAILFRVTDTGPGIEPEQRDRIFDRFAQEDSSVTRRFGGSGLGLAICRELVHLMEGEIGVESEKGQGASFWFSLPLRPADVDEKPVARDVQLTATGDTGVGHKVLVVDDVNANLQVVAALLRHSGYEVDTACNGQEAIEALGLNAFDLVLMDIQMPVMSGDEAIRRIRRMDGEISEIPIFALTADATQRTKDLCRSIGATGYLSKPLNLPAMLTAIQSALQASSGKRTVKQAL